MKRFWLRMFDALTRDDLFLRVACLLCGTGFGGIGIALLSAVPKNDLGVTPPWFVVFLCIVAIFLTAWGALLIARCFLPAQSRIARFADTMLPDANGLDNAAVAIVIVLFPVVLLMLLLRLLGVRGSVTDSDKKNTTPGVSP
jgi:hypothetical protein